jgi:hypothetical protein
MAAKLEFCEYATRFRFSSSCGGRNCSATVRHETKRDRQVVIPPEEMRLPVSLARLAFRAAARPIQELNSQATCDDKRALLDGTEYDQF